DAALRDFDFGRSAALLDDELRSVTGLHRQRRMIAPVLLEMDRPVLVGARQRGAVPTAGAHDGNSRLWSHAALSIAGGRCGLRSRRHGKRRDEEREISSKGGSHRSYPVSKSRLWPAAARREPGRGGVSLRRALRDRGGVAAAALVDERAIAAGILPDVGIVSSAVLNDRRSVSGRSRTLPQIGGVAFTVLSHERDSAVAVLDDVRSIVIAGTARVETLVDSRRV